MKVSVSSIREFEYCPRALYLKRVAKIDAPFTQDRAARLACHLVRKELSMRQPEVLSNAQEKTQVSRLVREEFERILDSLPVEYGDRMPGADMQDVTRQVKRGVEPELDLISGRLQSLVDEHGIEKAVEAITPVGVKCRLDSEELGLKGVVDKVMRQLIPVGVKTGRAGAGVWNADALQLCAYGMLLEQHSQTEVNHGLVEYTAIQEQRAVYFTDGLRRTVLEARDRVLEVLSGVIPEVCPHGSGRKCEACGLKETCYRL